MAGTNNKDAVLYKVSVLSEQFCNMGISYELSVKLSQIAIELLDDHNKKMTKVIIEATRAFISDSIRQEAYKTPDQKTQDALKFAATIAEKCGHYTERGHHATQETSEPNTRV